MDEKAKIRRDFTVIFPCIKLFHLSLFVSLFEHNASIEGLELVDHSLQDCSVFCRLYSDRDSTSINVG